MENDPLHCSRSTLDMRASEHTFVDDGGGVVRVVVTGDVVSLPHQGWSYPGFGAYISIEWLLSRPSPKLPGGSEARRTFLARCVQEGLRLHEVS